MSRDKSDRSNRRKREYDWREEYRKDDEYDLDDELDRQERGERIDRRNRRDQSSLKRRNRRGRSASRYRKNKDRDDGVAGWIAIALLLAIIIVLGIIAFKFFWKGEIPWEAPLYETNADFEVDGEEKETDRLNVAVLPDYVVTEASPYILIPYPKDNVYETEFVFRDADTGKEMYSTKRIRPGTVVRVEANNFCKIGKNPMMVEVKLFDPKTWDEVESAVVLETEIVKGDES